MGVGVGCVGGVCVGIGVWEGEVWLNEWNALRKEIIV